MTIYENMLAAREAIKRAHADIYPDGPASRRALEQLELAVAHLFDAVTSLYGLTLPTDPDVPRLHDGRGRRGE